MEIIEPTINDPDEISLFYICKIILIIIYAMFLVVHTLVVTRKTLMVLNLIFTYHVAFIA